jgi:ferric-dicitrate binding protein FerR (iron transport regulator)
MVAMETYINADHAIMTNPKKVKSWFKNTTLWTQTLQQKSVKKQDRKGWSQWKHTSTRTSRSWRTQRKWKVDLRTQRYEPKHCSRKVWKSKIGRDGRNGNIHQRGPRDHDEPKKVKSWFKNTTLWTQKLQQKSVKKQDRKGWSQWKPTSTRTMRSWRV